MDPKLGVPKMARPDFPYCKFHFFPRWSLWSGEGGRGFWGRGPPLGFNYSKEALGGWGMWNDLDWRPGRDSGGSTGWAGAGAGPGAMVHEARE